MNRVKQWLKKHEAAVIIVVLTMLFLWWCFGEKYYVECKLIYQCHIEEEIDVMVLNNMCMEYALSDESYVQEEVKEIIKNYDASEYDVLKVCGGSVEGLLLAHDNVYYCEPVFPKKDGELISYYLIPNVYFIPDDWY